MINNVATQFVYEHLTTFYNALIFLPKKCSITLTQLIHCVKTRRQTHSSELHGFYNKLNTYHLHVN